MSAIDLVAADLSGANLQGSDLSNADLRRAILVHANLNNTRLSNADVSAANLQSANLSDAKVDGIRYSRRTRFRGVRVSTCYGSSRFRRFAEDQDFIEEFKEAFPLGYYVWLSVTDCGRSLLRVVVWCLILAMLFGVVYYLLGEQTFNVSNRETLRWSLFTTVYYSVVTFTTLGFGDITPRTPLAAGIVMLEVIVGYLMLGILISILATKVARRS
ncbi:MAG: pentapeptide repeat-containing protein [Exilibacterium sp.]